MNRELLWRHYVLRRGKEVEPLWRELFQGSPRRILYIAGLGFDPRTISGPRVFKRVCEENVTTIGELELWLVESGDYELPSELRTRTRQNERILRDMFPDAKIASHKIESRDSDGILRTSYHADNLLNKGRSLDEYSDIILDISSLPRVVYLTFLVGLLGRLLEDKKAGPACLGIGTTLHIVAAEDAVLDSKILSEEIDSDVKPIKGFSGGLGAEVSRDWPIVWFPLLGERREAQLRRVFEYIGDADVCPIVPHPTRDPRRGDNILVEYRDILFEELKIDPNSIMYVDERNPFEAYRQLRDAMVRYSESLKDLGGCKLLVTPLSSKLITVGAGLACFEMHDNRPDSKRMIGIPYAEPHRYRVEDISIMGTEEALVTVLLLTGAPYER